MGTATNQAERQTQVETTPEIVDALLEVSLTIPNFSFFAKLSFFSSHCSFFLPFFLLFFFSKAARYDDFEDITSLASSGVSLDSKDSQGRTGYYQFYLSSILTFHPASVILFLLMRS
jgi:hypothetical protein